MVLLPRRAWRARRRRLWRVRPHATHHARAAPDTALMEPSQALHTRIRSAHARVLPRSAADARVGSGAALVLPHRARLARRQVARRRQRRREAPRLTLDARRHARRTLILAVRAAVAVRCGAPTRLRRVPPHRALDAVRCRAAAACRDIRAWLTRDAVRRLVAPDRRHIPSHTTCDARCRRSVALVGAGRTRTALCTACAVLEATHRTDGALGRRPAVIVVLPDRTRNAARAPVRTRRRVRADTARHALGRGSAVAIVHARATLCAQRGAGIREVAHPARAALRGRVAVQIGLPCDAGHTRQCAAATVLPRRASDAWRRSPTIVVDAPRSTRCACGCTLSAVVPSPTALARRGRVAVEVGTPLRTRRACRRPDARLRALRTHLAVRGGVRVVVVRACAAVRAPARSAQ